MKSLKGLVASLAVAAALLLLALPARADMATDLQQLNRQLLVPMALADFQKVGPGYPDAHITRTQIQMLDTHTARITMQVQLKPNGPDNTVPHVYVVHLMNRPAHHTQASYLITKPDEPKFHLRVGLDSQRNVVLLQGPSRLE
ncbi:MAG: hypothetical protein ACYCW6_18675 [Candidatus Xenobia bacterium]